MFERGKKFKRGLRPLSPELPLRVGARNMGKLLMSRGGRVV
jgi:hypothetical protein